MLSNSNPVGDSMEDYDQIGTFEELDKLDSGSHAKDSQSSETTDERFVESDQRKANLLSKIELVKEKLRAANKAQQIDVEEFLKVNAEFSPLSNAENPQMMRIRQSFEKKNKKSAQLIQSLQKKLENYQQVLKAIESGGPTPPVRRIRHDNVLSSVGQGLKDVGANIKGYTGTVISVPKDLANRLLRRSGSADNIPVISPKTDMDLVTVNAKAKSSTAGGYYGGDFDVTNPSRSVFYASVNEKPRSTSGLFYLPKTVPDRLSRLGDATARTSTPQGVGGGVAAANGEASSRAFGQPPIQMQRLSIVSAAGLPDHHESMLALGGQMKKLHAEVEKCRDQVAELRVSVEEMRTQFQQEYTYLHNMLHEEKYKSQRLEDQINDQNDLHQAETTNLRLEVQNLEGRLSYQVNSRIEDIQDEYGKLTSEVSSLKGHIKEVQQFIGMEGLEGLSINAKCTRGLMLLVQFLADFLLVIVSLLNRRHVKAALTILLVAFIVYHAGGYLVWNFVIFLFNALFNGRSTSSSSSSSSDNDENNSAALPQSSSYLGQKTAS